MDVYMLNQKKDMYRKLLRVFDYKNYYKTTEKIDYDSLRFIDEYRIIDFFIRLIEAFDISNDLSNSMYMLNLEVEKWNNVNPSKKIKKEHLLKKYYLLTEKNRVIVNPEVIHGDISRYNVDKNYAEFVELFSKTIFLYPLFQEDKWIEVLRNHNNKFKTKLTKDILLGDYAELHSVIFHNDRKVGDAFIEALKRKINYENYETWRLNIEYNFTLLMEIDSYEIDISSVIQSMDKNKQKILVEFSFNKLIDNNEDCIFDDLNFLNRLKYVPYELEGENICIPGKDSRLIAYNPNYYDNLNIFGRLEEENRWFGNFEFNGYYSRLIKEIPFIFKNFRNLFTIQQWEEVMCKKFSNIYRYYFYVYILIENDLLIEFKSMEIAPLIIEKIININELYHQENDYYLFTDEFKMELLQFYIECIREYSSMHFKLIMDFYFDLSQKQIMNNKNITLIKGIKEIVTNELLKYMNDNQYKYILFKRIEDYTVSDNFYLFDLFSQCKENYVEFKNEMVYLIIKKYFELLNEDKFYSNYYDFKGINNLLEALNVIKDDESYRNKLFIDFTKIFNPQTHKDGVMWSEYFLISKKLRFHLGVLCLLMEDKKWNDDIANYILDNFKYIKINSDKKHNPLSWEEIVQDTFRLQHAYDNLKNEEILTYHIIKLLIKKDSTYVNKYIKEIEGSFCYFESILFNKIFKGKYSVTTEYDKNIKGIGLGMGMKNSYFLLHNGYPRESLDYIDYVDNIFEKKGKNFYEQDYLNLLKYYCFINIKDYNRALEVANKIQDKSKSVPKAATVQYFMKNYSLSKQLFERHFQNFKPDIEAIVNYSAVLISMDMYNEAVEWCEKYIDKYREEYLLNANLACAYANIDNVKSLYYYNEAKRRNPGYKPAIYGTIENINNIIGELPTVLNSLEEFDKKGNFAKAFTETSQKTIKKLNDIFIPDDEIRILMDINKAIQLVSEKPIYIEKLNENELSDMIKDYLKMSMDHYGYEVARESPQGYATSKPGELDLFIFKSGENYNNIATGENKTWGQGKFKKQMGQLFGYLREYGGFGFTIIFNKETKLESVLKERNDILENFYFEDDEGNKIFQKVGPIIDMACYSSEINEVLLTTHKNPEKEDSFVRIYHYIVNVSRQERKNIAKQIRQK